MAPRINIRPKHRRIKPSLEEEKELIEFEVAGKLVNRILKPAEEASDRVNDFYFLYGDIGKAFFIRQSKMNFKSLMKSF